MTEMNIIDIDGNIIWEESVKDDISFEDFEKLITGVPGWKYQYHILEIAMKRFKKGKLAECERFLSLFIRTRDFDPILCTLHDLYAHHIFLLQIFELNKSKEGALTNREFILELFFPVYVRQRTLDMQDVDEHLSSMSELGMQPTLLTITMCNYFVAGEDASKQRAWKAMYEKCSWRIRDYEYGKDQIPNLFMLFNGGGSGRKNADETLLMVKITENFLFQYEACDGVIEKKVDIDDEDVVYDNQTILPLRRRDISLSYDRLVAKHYTRVFEEFLSDVEVQRSVYWKTLTYLFQVIRINPFFIVYRDEREATETTNRAIKKPPVDHPKPMEFYKRHLTCLMQAVYRLKIDRKLMREGKSPIDAYASRVKIIDNRNAFTLEDMPMLYLQFLTWTTEQFSLIAKQMDCLDEIVRFSTVDLPDEEVSKVQNKVGLVALFQVCFFLLEFINDTSISDGAHPFLSSEALAKHPADDDFLATKRNIAKLAFTGAEVNTYFYLDDEDYSTESLKVRFGILKTFSKSIQRETCLRCTGTRSRPPTSLGL